MSDKDAFGDRMKMYEKLECSRRFMPLLPIVARIDGKCFSTLTRGMDRPFDQQFSNMMQETTLRLVEQSGAKVGYTQSDEITLIFNSDDLNTQVYFDGKIQKMVSVLASAATVYFNKQKHEKIPESAMAMFDARVWTMPSKVEAANAVLWRESDATKNSVSMAARACYSHKELHNKTSAEMQEMLHKKGVNWNDYPAHFKRGTYFQRRTVEKKFTAEEIAKFPERHAAKANPDLVFKRTEVRNLDMPIFSKVTNRVGVIFDGQDPVLTRDPFLTSLEQM